MVLSWALVMGTVGAVWGLRLASRYVEQRGARAGGDGDLGKRVARLEQLVGDDLRGLEERVTELEERQEFAERLLTRATRDRVPGGET